MQIYEYKLYKANRIAKTEPYQTRVTTGQERRPSTQIHKQNVNA